MVDEMLARLALLDLEPEQDYAAPTDPSELPNRVETERWFAVGLTEY